MTPRQREALILTCKGLTRCEIAGVLGTTLHVARYELERVRSELGVKTSREALLEGIRRGLWSLEEIGSEANDVDLPSRREQCAVLLAQGLTIKQTAEHMRVSEDTVKANRDKNYKDLDVHCTIELTIWALITGRLSVD